MKLTKICGEKIAEFIVRRFSTPNNLSKAAGSLVISSFDWTIVKWDAYPYVDVVVLNSNKTANLRLEIKYRSNIRYKLNDIGSTISDVQSKLEVKRLDGLLFCTPTQKDRQISEGFKRVERYCLLGSFVSSEELETMSADKVTKDMMKQLTSHLDEDEDFLLHLQAEIQQVNQIVTKQEQQSKEIKEIKSGQEQQSKEIQEQSKEIKEIKNLLHQLVDNMGENNKDKAGNKDRN